MGADQTQGGSIRHVLHKSFHKVNGLCSACQVQLSPFSVMLWDYRRDAGKQPSTLHPNALLDRTAEIRYECDEAQT